MWPFSKKLEVPENEWTVAQGENRGNPMFIRFNAGLQGLGAKEHYAYRVGCAVPLKAPNEHGLPAKEEFAALDAIEDALVQSFGEHTLLAVVITTSGMREFVFYTAKPKAVETAHQELKTRFEHELQLIIQHDPAWNVYADFTPQGAGPQ